MGGYGKLRSALDATRREEETVALGDTQILLSDQASTQGTPYLIKTSPNPSWKFGRLYLAPSRLFFTQGRDVFFVIPINKIAKVSVVAGKKWLGRRAVKQLSIELSGGNRPFYISTYVTDPQIWKEAIEKLMEER